VEALEFFTQLTREDEVTPSGVAGYNFDQFTNAFATERASMMVNGNFTVNLFNTDYPDLDFGVALVPENEGKEHSSFSGGELIAIPASSQFEEQALEFIRFALSEEVQVEAWAKNGVIPVRNDLFENRYFEEEPKYKVFAEALNVAECPYTTKYYELYNPLLTAMQDALRGEQSPEAAFSGAKQEMDRILQG
jgi:multiple sugar transport system substrate-binding protein